MQSAQDALAARDFDQSATYFSAANKSLTEARSELKGALDSSHALVAELDVTGAVSSGDALLVAGEHLTKAGEELSHALAILQRASFTDTDSPSDSKTVIEAIHEARLVMQRSVNHLASADAALGKVKKHILPTQYRSDVAKLTVAVPRVQKTLEKFLAESDLLLAVFGDVSVRQYLLLFQNNHEQRPTGGFIGSVGLVNVDNGVLEEIDVQTVYDPDGQLKEYIAPPWPLMPITDRWYMRDSNWFADYTVSARKTADFFEKEGGPSVDGVIAITPNVIQELLRLTGPIAVPEYDTIVDAESFVAITQDLVTYSYDREENRPKQFLADLAPLLLSKVLQDTQQNPLSVLNVLFAMIEQKHLLVYLTDQREQERIADLGISGQLPRDHQGLLHVVNANIGGHKSDQFIAQEIDYRSVILPSGDVDVTVTIRRTHNGPSQKLDLPYPPGEDPAFKDNQIWQRVFVPPSAELIEATGFTPRAAISHFVEDGKVAPLVPDSDVAVWEQAQSTHATGTTVGHEAGLTYFGNWITTKPGATTVALYRYRLPSHADLPHSLDPASRYLATVIKQAGDTNTTIRVEITTPLETQIKHSVPIDGLTQHNSNNIVYRGALTTDMVVGAVLVPR